MIILDIIAIKLSSINALLFAYWVFAIGFLLSHIAFVFFVSEYAQHRIRVPLSPSHGANPFGIQLSCYYKATLAFYIVIKYPPHDFRLARINYQLSLLVFVIPNKASSVNDNFAFFKFSPIPPL